MIFLLLQACSTDPERSCAHTRYRPSGVAADEGTACTGREIPFSCEAPLCAGPSGITCEPAERLDGWLQDECESCTAVFLSDSTFVPRCKE